MKPRNPLSFKPAIGVLIDRKEVAVSVTMVTPRGRREVARQVSACEEDSPLEALRALLEPWVPVAQQKGKRREPWIRLGLPTARVFQATVPMTSSNRQQTAQNIFLEAVQATNVRAEDRIVEMLKMELDGRPLASVAAAPRVAIDPAVGVLTQLGTRVALIEPAPAGLCRAGAYFQKAPRKSKLCIRFFLGDAQALGVLIAGSLPLFWHTFDLTKGDEAATILAAYSTLWMMARDAMIATPIDTVIVHGRPDIALPQLEQESFQKRIGAQVKRCAEPGNDLGAAAFGLALADPFAGVATLDLGRTIKPEVTIRDIFPYGELIAHCALVGAVSLYLTGVGREAQHRLRATAGEAKKYTWLANQDQRKLDEEKKAVEERLKALTKFRDSRAQWSGLLRTIAAGMPHSTIITALSGDAELDAGGRPGPSQAKKKLVVSFETPVTGNGSLPPEIDGFLAKLRSNTSLKRHFPLIEVTGFRTNPARQGTAPSASFSVVCLPEAKKAAPPARPAPAAR